ncbi:MAG: hypothetical protein OXR66_03540 [Candidatus Woesearchaeota archaeon]|nr:hypothetical protein [Candidatus Woesearchaeota archaeon]
MPSPELRRDQEEVPELSFAEKLMITGVFLGLLGGAAYGVITGIYKNQRHREIETTITETERWGPPLMKALDIYTDDGLFVSNLAWHHGKFRKRPVYEKAKDLTGKRACIEYYGHNFLVLERNILSVEEGPCPTE